MLCIRMVYSPLVILNNCKKSINFNALDALSGAFLIFDKKIEKSRDNRYKIWYNINTTPFYCE